jgi:hypothetical protein
MSVCTIFYYPVVYGEGIVRDESLPLVDKVLSVVKERLSGDIFKSISFSVYRWNDVFIVKHSVNFCIRQRRKICFLRF